MSLENREAERELLGALLAYFTPDLLTRVRGVLRDDDWSDPRHRIVWRAVCAVSGHGDHVDTVTVGSFLRGHRDREKRSYLDLAGGEAMLQLLVSHAVPNGVVERARIVAMDGEWRRRRRSCLAGLEACEARDEDGWREAMGEGPRLRVIEGERQAS